MQHRHEELEATVMKGGESSTVKIIQTQKEAAADAKASVNRAESHTRTQMELLIGRLRAKQQATSNATVRRSIEEALVPLEVRMKRYTDAEDAARERARKQQLAREEAEFQASINAWVSAGQGDVVEKTFTAVAEWQAHLFAARVLSLQVENSHARDVARDKWRLRAKDQKLAAKVRALPKSLQWLGKGIAEVSARASLYGPGVPREIDQDDKAARIDRLVDILWEWQSEVDIALCDAYDCEAFDYLPESVQALDLGATFLAGRNPTRPMFWGATAPSDAVINPPEVGGNPRLAAAAAANPNAAATAAMSATATAGAGGANQAGSNRSNPNDNNDDNDSTPATSSRASGVSSLNLLTGKVQVRPWTPTPFGYRNELRDERKAMIEAHLMRPELIPDLHTKMRVQSLVQELLWKLAELDEEGDTTSSSGEGGSGIGGSQGRGVNSNSSFSLLGALVGRSHRTGKVAALDD